MSPALQLHCKSNTHSFLSTEAKDVWRRTRFMFLAHRRGVLEAGFSYYLAHQYISTVSISLLDQWAQRGSQSASSVAFFLITFIRIHLAYRVRSYIFAFIVSGGTWWNFNDSSFCELWNLKEEGHNCARQLYPYFLICLFLPLPLFTFERTEIFWSTC